MFFVEVRSFGVTPAIYGAIFNEIIMHQIVTFRLLDILLGEDMGSWDAENEGKSLFCSSNDRRRACFSLSMQPNDPTKLRIYFEISSLPPPLFFGG